MTPGFQPTTLFEHCSPPNISGLYTVNDTTGATKGGWDRRVLAGAFTIFQTQLWSHSQVGAATGVPQGWVVAMSCSQSCAKPGCCTMKRFMFVLSIARRRGLCDAAFRAQLG